MNLNFCPNCGVPLAGSLRCAKCGTTVAPAPTAPHPQSPPPYPLPALLLQISPADQSRIVTAFVFSILSVCLAGFAGLGFSIAALVLSQRVKRKNITTGMLTAAHVIAWVGLGLSIVASILFSFFAVVWVLDFLDTWMMW